MMGQKIENLSFPVCTNFVPTLNNGQVCYGLNLSSLQTLKTRSGPDTGLFLILDPSSSLIQEENEFDQAKKAFTIRLSPKSSSTNSVRFYLNTLSRFMDYRDGSYTLSVLKKMAGTTHFLSLSEMDKKCQVETFEACQTERYIKEVQKRCGCLPWRFGFSDQTKVTQNTINVLLLSCNALSQLLVNSSAQLN